MNAPPTIETDRLRLRAYRISDLDGHAAMMGDAEVVRFLGGQRLDREQSWRMMIGVPGLWDFLGYGFWAAERRDDGEFLGQVGFGEFERDIAPPIDGRPEMGWLFAPHAQGRGYAHEACRAALDWADEALAGQEIVAIIDPDHERSLRLAARLGFGDRVTARYKNEDIVLLRRKAGLAT
ncbi:MAG: GNAT family N-acetyltransferase [Sphingomonadaceae bacterium]